MSPVFALEPEIVPVVIGRWHVGNAVHEGPEVLLLATGGETHRAEGHPVIGAAAGDDLVAFGKPAERLRLFRDLEGGLDRFRSTGAKKDATEVAGRDSGECFRELDCRDRRVVRAGGIRDLAGLRGHGLADLATSMSDIDDHQTGEAVQVLSPPHVVECRVLGSGEHLQPLAFGELLPIHVPAMEPEMVGRGPLELWPLEQRRCAIAVRRGRHQRLLPVAGSGVQPCSAVCATRDYRSRAIAHYERLVAAVRTRHVW